MDTDAQEIVDEMTKDPKKEYPNFAEYYRAVVIKRPKAAYKISEVV